MSETLAIPAVRVAALAIVLACVHSTVHAQKTLKPDKGSERDAAASWVSVQDALVRDRLLGGSWVEVSASLNGKKVGSTGGCWEFGLQSHRYWLRGPGELSPVTGGPIRIDVTKTPMHLDVLSVRRNPARGGEMSIFVVPCIFKFQGNTMVWARPQGVSTTKEGSTAYYMGQPYTMTGEYSDRPKDFEPAKGKEVYILRKNSTDLYQGPLPGEKGETLGTWVEF